MPLDVIGELGRSVVEVVGEKRSTWRRWNLMAEASRQTMGWRFATMQDREAIVAMVADAAELVSLRLTPPELAASPVVFRRPDGTSVFRPKSSTVFTSEAQLAAEDRLLERAAQPRPGRRCRSRPSRRSRAGPTRTAGCSATTKPTP